MSTALSPIAFNPEKLISVVQDERGVDRLLKRKPPLRLRDASFYFSCPSQQVLSNPPSFLGSKRDGYLLVAGTNQQ